MKKSFLLIAVCIISLTRLLAQSQDVSRKYRSKVPELYGHSFLSTTNINSSFTNTSLQADLGFGTTSDLSIPGITIGDIEIAGFEGALLFFNMGFEYQQRFTPWLALYTAFGVGGRIGTDISTIVVDGVNTVSSGRVGWLIRIKKTNRLNLSCNIGLNTTTGSFLNVSKYIEEIINGDPDATVSNTVPSMTAVIGLRGAYAFSPTFGLQFDTKYGYGESLARGNSAGYLSAGIVGDVDFYPGSNTPIGLAIGLGVSSVPDVVMRDGGISKLFLGKIAYTGSDEFELGFQYTLYDVSIESIGHKPFISKLLLTMKYYF